MAIFDTEIKYRHDMVVGDGGHGLSFCQKLLTGAGPAADAFFENFQCDQAFQAFIPGSVNDPKGTITKLFLKIVAIAIKFTWFNLRFFWSGVLDRLADDRFSQEYRFVDFYFDFVIRLIFVGIV